MSFISHLYQRKRKLRYSLDKERLKQARRVLKSPAPRWKPMIMIVRHCGANGITPAIPSADLLKNGCLRFRLQTKC